MGKRVSLIILAIVLLMAFSAYAAEPVTIRYWGHSNPFFEEGNRQVIEAFEKENPHIKVVYETFPYDTFLQKTLTSFSVGEEPDIMEMSGRLILYYGKQGLADPVPESIMTKSQIEDTFFPGAIGGYLFEDNYYGLPKEYNFEYGGILANMEILEEVGVSSLPTTWDELVEVAQKATVRRGDLIARNGFYVGGHDATTYYFLAFLLQNGGQFWNEDHTAVAFDTPEGKKALQDLADLSLKHKIMRRESTSAVDMFAQKRAAMVAVGAWAISYVRSEYPDLALGYFATPSISDSPPIFAAQSGWGFMVSKNSRNREAAWEFAKFAMQEEQAKTWLKATLNVPSMKQLSNDPELLEVNPYLEVPFAMMPYGLPLGDLRNAQQFVRIISDHVDAVTLGGEDVDQAVKAMETEINQIIYETDHGLAN